jgi:hypothetical protein
VAACTYLFACPSKDVMVYDLFCYFSTSVPGNTLRAPSLDEFESEAVEIIEHPVPYHQDFSSQ